MGDRTVRLVLTGDSKRAIAALEEVGLKAEIVGKKTETAFGDHIQGAATKSGGALSKLSNTLGAFGVPFTGSLDKMSEKIADTHTKGQKFGAALNEIGKVASVGILAGAAVIGTESVKMAGNFQQQMSKLVTSGGESARSLNSDMASVEKLMGQTGTSSDQLAKGLYTINSAGFHGAEGVQVLKAAAQGAKTENADLGEVTDGLTTLLNDYHIKASDAALVTSKMVTATSLGKTTFQDLAGSLHTVSPAADAAGLSMDQVLGAMATMTAKGTPAADAATYLRQTILQLSNPSAKAANEMAALGLSSIDVSKNLGARGLTGTLDLLTGAIASKMGPAGTVLIGHLKAAAAAGSGWQAELAKMTPAQQAQIDTLATQGVQMDKYKQQLADLAPSQRTLVNNMASGATNTMSFQRAFAAQSPAMQAHIKDMAAGAKGYRDYQATVAALPPTYRTTLAGATASKEGFRDLTTTLAQLPPVQQTAVGALADMVGGTKSMQAALELTGGSAATFKTNVDKVGKTTTEAGGNVAGWGTVQKNFNQKLSEGTQTVEALGIKLGLWLIPKVEATVKAISGAVTWFQKHKAVAEALAGVIGGALSLAIGAFTVNKIAGMVKGVAAAGKTLGDLGGSAADLVKKLLGLQGTAADTSKAAGTAIGDVNKAGSAASTSLTGAGTTAATSIESGAATAEADLVAGGSAAETSLAAGGATAEGDLAAGGAKGAVGGGAAAAGGMGLGAAAGVGTGLAAIAAITGYGLYLGANPSAISAGAAYSDSFGMPARGGLPDALASLKPLNLGTLSNFGSANLSRLSGLSPGRAAGGPVTAGQAYLVGEQGPEPFIPSSSGTILPYSKAKGLLDGSGHHTHIHIENLTLPNVVNANQLVADLQQKARTAALAGGSGMSR